jgi:excinuclease ABC subunit C
MSNLDKKIKSLPNSPGVYLFKNKSGAIIYIGKSGNLKNRVKSYFLARTKFFNPAKVKMLSEIANIEIIKTESEISALIKESELIKKHKPKFNVLMKDSKNYLFVGFTKDKFTKIILTHQPQSKTPNPKHQITNKSKIQNSKSQTINYIGPFTDSTAVKKTLHILRDIFPYCTCKQKHNIKCLNAHMGKCLGFCCLKQPNISTSLKVSATSNISFSYDRMKMICEREKYRENIKKIRAILSGKSQTVLKELKKEIKLEIKKQNFERASELKKQIFGLESILAHAKVLTNKFESIPSIFKDTSPDFRLLGFDKNPARIETYDISNIQGSESVGSMVVFKLMPNGNYSPDKNEYRKFKIKTVIGINDPAMIAEIISRRFKNNWKMPDLIVIDGGITQLNAALKAIETNKIKVLSLAKRLEEIYIPGKKNPVPAQLLGKSMKYLFQSMRDEAHRFAIGYHRKLRRKSLINQI